MAERGTFRAARPLMPPLETRTGEPKCCIAQTLPSHPPACHESERHACSLSHIPRWGPTVGSRWQHASSSFLRVPCRLMLSLGLSSGSGFAMIPWSRVPIAERRPSASWFLISVICRYSPSRTDETAHEPLSLGPLNPRLWLCRAISTSMGKNFLLTDRARWRRSSTTKNAQNPGGRNATEENCTTVSEKRASMWIPRAGRLLGAGAWGLRIWATGPLWEALNMWKLENCLEQGRPGIYPAHEQGDCRVSTLEASFEASKSSPRIRYPCGSRESRTEQQRLGKC